MAGLFVAALFASAALLFWVQPMVARMLLPLLGGSTTVWNTCMVFYQATLLAGYAYAHFLSTRVSVRLQTGIHLVLMALAFAVLPIGLAAGARTEPWRFDPSLWLLGSLVTVVGLPFFVLSASAPLLQSWFGRARHRWSGDPYFLYAASNVGSLAGLLGYPVLIEPALPLPTQTRIWTALYCLLMAMFAGCAVIVLRRHSAGGNSIQPPSEILSPSKGAIERVSWPRRWRWMFQAFIPSSLMLGVTTYLTTDIASVPLLWVVPLGIYLLTFVAVFARRQVLPLKLLVRVLPPLAVFLVFVLLNNADNLAWLQIVLHLLFLFVAAMVWHTRLAKDRPAPGKLTEFYFCMAAGGVLGGLFNALLAPAIFRTVVEYRLMIVLACLLWPVAGQPFPADRKLWRGLVMPAGIGLLTGVLAVLVPRLGAGLQLSMLVVFGVPVILCYVVSRRPHPFQFALSLAAVLTASRFYTGFRGHTLHVERNFFGTLRFTLDPQERFYRLYDGTTVHGMRFKAPEQQDEPLAYYHRTGPCGQAFKAFYNSRSDAANIGVIGLGAGSMASYAQTGQRWTFYEINPAVVRLARDTNYFTFLEHCTNAPVDFKIGDARLRLREAPDQHYDLLVCDAFGSDAPPLHLLNREAIELYLSKLAPRGLLLLHVSSRFLDFRPVIGNLAAHFQLSALVGTEDEQTEETMRQGKLPSTWVALARRPEDLGALTRDPRWLSLPLAPGMRLWTDDYSNILGVFEW